MKTSTGMCVGCGEARGTIRVEGLGKVCELCHEVVDIVIEVEIERTEEACRQVEAFLATHAEKIVTIKQRAQRTP